MVHPARNGLVDYGRFAAALGIVWFHTQAPGLRVAYVSLPFFLVLLAMPSRATPGVRARRLLIPFLQWSVVYALVLTAFALRTHAAPLGWWHWSMIFTGTSLHLWFLPFAFAVSVLAPLFRPPLMAPAAALAVAAALCLFGTPDTAPLAQWSFGLIPVLIGFAYFSAGWRLAVATLPLCWLVLSLWRPSPDNVTIMVGTALALCALTLRLMPTRLSDWCARLSMWVYLAHPLVIISGRTIGLSGILLGLFSLIGTILLAQGIETSRQLLRRSTRIGTVG